MTEEVLLCFLDILKKHIEPGKLLLCVPLNVKAKFIILVISLHEVWNTSEEKASIVLQTATKK